MAALTIPIEFELSPRSRAIIDAITRGMPDHTTPQAAEPTSARPVPPAPGDHWPEQAGHYAGVVSAPDGTRWHLILPDGEAYRFSDATWGKEGAEVTGADSAYDGHANTIAMTNAGSDLAQHIRALPDDCYLPSRAEALLLLTTLKKELEKEWYWTSTQYSANNAWCQYFYNGSQYLGLKSWKGRAVAVRRLIF